MPANLTIASLLQGFWTPPSALYFVYPGTLVGPHRPEKSANKMYPRYTGKMYPRYKNSKEGKITTVAPSVGRVSHPIVGGIQ